MKDIENGAELLSFQLRVKGQPADYPPEMMTMILALKGMNFISNSGDEDWQGVFKGQVSKAWVLEFIKTIPAELHARLEIAFGGWPLEDPITAAAIARSDYWSELWKKLDTPIEELELSIRATNGLKQLGVGYLGHLAQQSEKWLMKSYSATNFGLKSRREVRDAFFAFGLTFGMETRGWLPPPSRTGAPE